ncbi:MAG: sugar ABC transporter substrate-binding protein [Fimbriimonas sp.]|nr:sugar ABC transporter substrate-binding protein [Fimbriimonas sp.]
MRTFLLVSIAVLVASSLLVWKLQPSSSEDGRIVLTWVSDENPARKAQAALFEKLHPNIKVNIDPANSGVEKVIVQCLAGVGPDVFDAFDVFQLSAFARSGVAMDVTDELHRHGIDLKAQVFSGILGTCVFEGRTYGIPNNIAADGLWYHADMLRNAGVSLPQGAWTWSEMIPIAQKLTLKSPDGRIARYGLMFEWWNWRHFFAGFGAHVFNSDGTRCTLDSPSAVAAVQMMYDLVYKYHVSPTPVEETSMVTQGGFGSGYISLFAAKRGAMAIGGRWWLEQLRQAKGLDLDVAESPYGTTHATHAYGRGLLVNKDSRHLQEALEFQRFLASEEYLDLINEQADGAAAFKAADEKPSFFHDPHHPEERYNAAWLHILEIGKGDDVSPYVDSNTVARLLQVQLDLIQAGQKAPAAGMRDAAANINDAIEKSVAEDPSLKERFHATVESTPR